MHYIKVSQDAFYDRIGNLDVSVEVVEPHPYKTNFRSKVTRVIVGYEDRDGNYYLLAEKD